MSSVQRMFSVSQPPDQVWSFLQDFGNSTHWHPRHVTVWRTSGDGGVGTTYRSVSRLLGTTRRVDHRVVERVEGVSLRVVGGTGSLCLSDTLTVLPRGHGSGVVLTMRLDPVGLMRPLRPVGAWALEASADSAADALAEHLESATLIGPRSL